MAYKAKDGTTRYTLKEKIKYHTELANKGKDNEGNALTTAQRVHHGVLAEKQKAKLNRFMKNSPDMRDAIVKQNKQRNK